MPEPKIVGYSKTAIFKRGVYKGQAGYLLWEVPAHIRPEYFGVCYYPKEEISARLYKTPMTEFMRLQLK